ncbi:MAG: hypothetical protein WBQ38_03920 [Ignavibacteria bacterium]|nr:hypothetical protein [Ignavibacteria bacterium]MBK9404400.1 hypothetical protein [Ignavibacteria bacterium]MBL0109002.1 hypothetical protein [Ignavibacteria bacterium]
MKDELKNEIEILTNIIIEIRRRRKDEHYEIIDTENSNKFKNLITNHIIPMVKDASSIVGRSGCSLNYYSNELAVIRDPKKRIFIQILFYPYGHSKVTLGVNAPFLQFAYSPLRENIKITEKISIKSDEGRTKIAEIEIDDFAQDKIDNYILSFLRDTIMFNS